MTVALDAALSGLRAAQQALNVVSNNIANASTDGYTRKILPQAPLLLAGQVHGVTLGAITRNVDKLMMRDLALQIGTSERLNVMSKYLDRIQQFNGASDTNSSLAASVSNLAQAFATLSNAPNDDLMLQKTLTAATATANKFNNFSKLLNDLRNQAENEISSSISIINKALQSVADLNTRITSLAGAGQATADLEDERDRAIQTISKYMQVSTYHADNGKIIVTTKGGQTLADGSAETIVFQKSALLPTSYPGSGIHPITVNGIDITSPTLGGAIGALIDLRDNILPTYNAQIDELAQKMAERMEQQGLRLFTDLSGNVPASTTSPVPVTYVGFAAEIKVNSQIIADPTLLRSGTGGGTVLPGSNEIIRKISQYAFGPLSSLQARGTVDISVGTIFASTGMQPFNKVIGNANIASYTPDLAANPDIAAGAQFTVTIGGVPQTITINGGDTAANLVSNINAAFGSTVASLNGLGQLVFTGNSTITLSDNTLGAAGMAALGFTFGATPPQNPSFTVRVGTQTPVTITIGPADTAATLLAALNAVPGLSATLDGGQLVLTPNEGGDITLTEGVGSPMAALGLAFSSTDHTPFRQDFLGPSGTLSTGLLANATLEAYARSIITGQSEEASAASANAEREVSYLQLLEKRIKDQTGVNIDEEMAQMIRIQSNYTAAAKMLATAERMLDELMQSIRV